MMNSVRNKILLLLLIVIALQNSALYSVEGLYGFLSIVSAVLTVLLLLTCFSWKVLFKFIKETKIFVFTFVFQATVLVILYGFGSRSVFPHLRDLLLSWLFTFVGYSLAVGNLNISKAINIQTYIASLSALSIVIFIAGGINISEMYYDLPKNQFGPYFAIAAVLSIYTAIPSTNNLNAKNFLLKLALVVPNVLVLVVVRTRTAMLSFAIILLLFIFHYTVSFKNKIKYFLAALLIIALNIETITTSLFLNYDTSNVDSVTAGRAQVYKEALGVIDQYPFTGRLFKNIEIHTNLQSEIIHNYLLFLYFEIGIFAAGFIMIYFMLLFKVIKDIINKKLFSGLLLCMLYVVSISEYTFPFSPGLTVFIPFLLMGYEMLKPIKSTID